MPRPDSGSIKQGFNGDCHVILVLVVATERLRCLHVHKGLSSSRSPDRERAVRVKERGSQL